jgi:hypothetical protein
MASGYFFIDKALLNTFVDNRKNRKLDEVFEWFLIKVQLGYN